MATPEDAEIIIGACATKQELEVCNGACERMQRTVTKRQKVPMITTWQAFLKVINLRGNSSHVIQIRIKTGHVAQHRL